MAATTDTALVERLRERDPSAWEEVYTLYSDRLYGFAYRLAGNPHDAADLVQETFVRALPRLDKLEPAKVDLAAYLFTTTRNVFLKGVERSKRAVPVEEVPEPAVEAPIELDPDRSTQLEHQQREVRLANAKLPPRQRLVLALRELEDRSYAEIGELVGLKENAVAQLISRARQSLREELRLLQVDPERLPEACRNMLPLLSAYLDGQLKGAKRDETMAHLESCERCQAALADMREAQRRYRSLVPPALMAYDLFQRCSDALAGTGYWRGPRRWVRRATAGAAAVAAFALLGLGIGAAYVVAEPEPGPYFAALAETDSLAETTAPTTTVAPPTAPGPITASTKQASTKTGTTTTTATTTTTTITTTTAKTKPLSQVRPKKPRPRPRATTVAPAPTTAATTTTPPPATTTSPPPTTTTVPTPPPTTQPPPPRPPDLRHLRDPGRLDRPECRWIERRRVVRQPEQLPGAVQRPRAGPGSVDHDRDPVLPSGADRHRRRDGSREGVERAEQLGDRAAGQLLSARAACAAGMRSPIRSAEGRSPRGRPEGSCG